MISDHLHDCLFQEAARIAEQAALGAMDPSMWDNFAIVDQDHDGPSVWWDYLRLSMSPLALIMMMMRVGLSVWKKVSERAWEDFWEYAPRNCSMVGDIWGGGRNIFKAGDSHKSIWRGDNLAGGVFLVQISHVTVRSGGGIYVSARGGKNIYIINQTSHQKDDQKTNKIDLCEQGGGADDLRRWDVGRLERGEVRDWVKHLLDNNDDKSFLDLWSWKMRAAKD